MQLVRRETVAKLQTATPEKRAALLASLGGVDLLLRVASWWYHE